MGRPKNALNVTEAEVERIRQLYVEGVRVLDIVRRTGRSESVVDRVTRDLTRRRPALRRTAAKRNALIARRVIEDGISQAEVARRFGLTPTRVCQIVREALGLIQPPHGRPVVTRQSKTSVNPPFVPAPTPRREDLSGKALVRQNMEIRRLVLDEEVPKAVVARRYGISPATVAKIVATAKRRSPRRR